MRLKGNMTEDKERDSVVSRTGKLRPRPRTARGDCPRTRPRTRPIIRVQGQGRPGLAEEEGRGKDDMYKLQTEAETEADIA